MSYWPIIYQWNALGWRYVTTYRLHWAAGEKVAYTQSNFFHLIDNT